MIARRQFLALPAALAGPRQGRGLPDLAGAAGRAVTCMANRMDPALGYRPWFAVEVIDGRPVRLRHDRWDFGDTGGRFVEAFVLARRMRAPDAAAAAAERQARHFFESLFGADGLVANPDLKGPDHMFAQGSALYALVAQLEDGEAVGGRIERMIGGLNRAAVQERDYLWFPQVATKIAACSHMAAYQVYPIVRFHEITRNEAALRYASRLSRWALDHDPTVTADGVITKTGWEGHLHAWMDTFSGILRCSRARGSGLDRAAVRLRSRRLLEWVKANYTSPFGWVADSVGSKTCETDTITSFIRLALELIEEDYPEYWDDIERFARNQLVENQFRDVSRLRLHDARLARGIEGAFESYADPNTLLAVKKGDIEGCCINGGIRGLWLAWQNAIRESASEIRVNLLVPVSAPPLELQNNLPEEGRLELLVKASKPVLLRLPPWLDPHRVQVDGPAGLRLSPAPASLRITGARPGSSVGLRFPLPEETRAHTVAGHLYHARWRGDTVTDIQPPGEPYPIFHQRA